MIIPLLFTATAFSISTGLITHHYTSYFPRTLNIPKKIFTTWHTKDIPIGMKENIENIKKNNLDFEHYFYDDADCLQFISNHFEKEVADAYISLIPYAYKADLWRYCVMYIHGGIYMDIKYKCTDNFKFSSLTDQEYFVKEYGSNGYLDITKVFNGFMVCAPNSSCLKSCIDSIVYNVKHKYYGLTPHNPTGPALLGKQFSCFEIPRLKLSYSIPKTGDKKGKQVIKFNNKIILEQYDNYRKDQSESSMKTTKQPYYTQYWIERKMYR